ncbi:DUF3302 domain-containing protein [Vibrio taketomensis]|uniref:DUF3302 domain-containing protein n=1 Tax=Vibrio taketomensis TaxID=2572923 RepID=UPI001389F4BB|nr:DUF3302 domain-containing protein [Vibrio taketomensis]
MFLDYFALGLLIFVVLVLFYGVIAIHDIPYEIAKSREHPHQDAIHYAGWVSLFTLHVLWPFLWIWATLWRKERGWGFHRLEEEQHDLHHRLEQLIDQVNVLQTQVDKLSAPNLPEAQTKATPSSDAQEKEQ